MRVATSKLKAGTVMLTGETIVSLEKSGKSYMARGPRLNVVLEKNGKSILTSLLDAPNMSFFWVSTSS